MSRLVQLLKLHGCAAALRSRALSAAASNSTAGSSSAKAPPSPSSLVEEDSSNAPIPTLGASPDAPRTDDPLALLKIKDTRIAELLDLYKRALAETQNLRERTRREVESAHQYALQKFAKDLLATADVLELAVTSVPKSLLEKENSALKALFDGLSMTNTELHQTLRRYGVDRIPTAPGDTFDPAIHHALFEAPVTESAGPGKVAMITKPGYKLNGRVLRPAHVGVAIGSEKSNGDGDSVASKSQNGNSDNQTTK